MGTGNRLIASTCNDGDDATGSAEYDTKISVFSSSCGFQCVDGNDDGNGCGRGSRVGWLSVAFEEYTVIVHGFRSSSDNSFPSGNFELSVFEKTEKCLLTETPPVEGTLIEVGSITSGTTVGGFGPGEISFPFCGTSFTSPSTFYRVVGTGNWLTASTCNDGDDATGSAEYDTKICITIIYASVDYKPSLPLSNL